MILLEPVCINDAHAKRGFEYVRQLLRKDIARAGVGGADFKVLEDVKTLELFVLFRLPSQAATWLARSADFAANEVWRADVEAADLAR